MKVTDILTHVSPALRNAAGLHANKFGAAGAVFASIGWRSGDLLNFADTSVPRYNRRRGFFFEQLPYEKRVLNLAERIVVAIRLEEATERANTSRDGTR